jgi:L-fucose mutarotase
VLKGIDPLLSGALLNILDDMGHGDQLLVVDRNYPAAASGKPVIRLGQVGVVRAVEAILTVFPLDGYVERPLERMEVEGDPATLTSNQSAVLRVATLAEGREFEFGVIPRLEFYARARDVFAIVHTLEAQPYGCFILQKGVVFDTDNLPPAIA